LLDITVTSTKDTVVWVVTSTYTLQRSLMCPAQRGEVVSLVQYSTVQYSTVLYSTVQYCTAQYLIMCCAKGGCRIVLCSTLMVEAWPLAE